MRRFWIWFFIFLFLCWATSLLFAQETGIQDDWGRVIKLSSPAKRIVSLAPSNTEILFALGLGEKVVGVTSYCNYPPEAQTKEKIGTITEINLERVVLLEPDLVLASSLTPREVVEKLEVLGMQVFVVDAHTIEEVLEDLQKVATLAGVPQEGETLVRQFGKKLLEIRAKTTAISEEKRPLLLHVIWHDPIWTAGNGTFVHEFITTAGGRNAAADCTGYVTLDLEEVIRRNPDIITVVSTHGNEAVSYEFLLSDPRLRVVRAIQEKKIFLVDSDIVSRPGPRII
ncbi:MAG: ABC transporter substrate-binding protein, partial [Candidatus Caldatribacteriaceae bacterium]